MTALSLILAYLAPAAVAAHASSLTDRNRTLSLWLGGYAILAGFAWLTLAVRLAYHPGAMGLWRQPVADGELWVWSGAWLLYGLGLMGLGIAKRNRLVRIAALGFVGLVCIKVFLWDMADLTGLWRVASFLGLGLSLIALGAMHRRFVLPVQQEPAA